MKNNDPQIYMQYSNPYRAPISVLDKFIEEIITAARKGYNMFTTVCRRRFHYIIRSEDGPLVSAVKKLLNGACSFVEMIVSENGSVYVTAPQKL